MRNSFIMNIKEALGDCAENVKSICYWNSVDKKFKEIADRKMTEFDMEFEHSSKIFDEFQPDDEEKIEAYASGYGYMIVDEQFLPYKTKYTFRKIK